jgi:8-oxo-dGTP pyrophosphatase MutT (NUDIX family)
MNISDQCPGEYVGVLLLTKDKNLIVQHRDNKDWIVWPDSLGVFGGNIEGSETLGEGAAREMKEELGIDIDPKKLVPFKTYFQTIEKHGQIVTCHIFTLSDIDPKNLIVYEGQGYKILTRETDIQNIKASPVMKEILVDYFHSLEK